jgi:hypothetical protein
MPSSAYESDQEDAFAVVERRVIELAAATAECLERSAASGGVGTLTEPKHLQPCCDSVAKRLAAVWQPPAVVSKPQVKDGGWPKLGPVDLALNWPGELPTFIELKCGGFAHSLDACPWDAIKSAYCLAHGKAGLTYLIAATPSAHWPNGTGVEMFRTANFDTIDLRDRYRSQFKRFENDGYPVAPQVPRAFATVAVADFPFTVDDKEWRLRVARVDLVDPTPADWPKIQPPLE